MPTSIGDLLSSNNSIPVGALECAEIPGLQRQCIDASLGILLSIDHTLPVACTLLLRSAWCLG